jgi:serine phosphatase RsbU (regulator of sigma subunit)
MGVPGKLRSERRLLAALLAWSALIAVADVLLGSNVVLIAFLATGPLVAAARGKPFTATLVGAVAVALALPLGAADQIFGSPDHLVRIAVVAVVSALAVWLAVTRARLERARFRFGLLADAGQVMSSTLDHEVTLIELARLCARRLSDWCFVFVREENGEVRQIAAAHVDPARERLAWELLRRYPLDLTRPEGPAKVMRTGEAELHPAVRDELIRAIAADEENLRLLRALELRSAMVTPLTAHGRVLGAIAFASAESGRAFTDDDLALAVELSARAAILVDNALLYEERSRIARTLQESLLPPLLPELPGVDVAARFRAAGEGIDVGGDFYDLFELGDSAWAVAIGDVCGKGTGAAAVTALARYTVRAAAMRQDGPSQILALLNEALLRQRTDPRFCTVLFGRIATNGRGASFEFASGGHPLPLLLRAEGGGDEIGEPGTLLGIFGDPNLSDAQVPLWPGDALMLYTDGVTDAGAPRSVLTTDELAAAVGPTAGLDADEIAERAVRAAVGEADGEPRDDIAVIVLKIPS